MTGFRAKYRVCILTLFAVCPLAASTQSSYFPPRAFDDIARNSDFMAEWYSAELKALGESSYVVLSKSPTAHSYRFTWLRTFNQPIVVRLDVSEDGTAAVTTKIANGEEFDLHVSSPYHRP